MKKSLVKGFVMVLLIAGLAVMSFAAKIYLKNGRVIDGEIISHDATSVTVKDPALGVITIARDNILKIDPPLEEPKPAPTPAAPVERPYVAPSSNGIIMGFRLSGGLSNINGGDFNKSIVDTNAYFSEWNAYDHTSYYAVDWKEMKWMPNFSGEVFVRFAKYFGIGLGVEFLSKSNPGKITYAYSEGPTRYSYTGYYYLYNFTENATWNYAQSMKVIPITLNFYVFFPVGRSGDFYVKAGPGYYLGTFETTENYGDLWEGRDVYYYNSGTIYPPHWYAKDDYSSTSYYKATCNAIGFHFGAGFDFDLGSGIALFGEALYRMVKFDNWQGNATYDDTDKYKSGWYNNSSDELTTVTSTYSDKWTGKAWYYENYSSYLTTKYYGSYGLFSTGDEPTNGTYVKNVRPAEFNINGFAFRVGIKIGFNLQ
jgi:hypothetical protein